MNVVGAAVVGGRRVRARPALGAGDGSVRAVRRSGDREGAAVDIGVVGEDVDLALRVSSAVSKSSPATGASFTGVTVTETRPVSDGPRPSETVYSKESSPLQFASGVYVQLPAAEQETVPCAAAGAGVVTLRASSSASGTRRAR